MLPSSFLDFMFEMKEISLRSFFILIHATLLTASIALGLSSSKVDDIGNMSKTKFNKLCFG